MKDNRPPPIFIADALGLDFLNSIAVPVDTQVEWLASGEDLLDWLVKAGLIPPDVPAALKKAAVPGELNAAAGQARALREWFRAFVHTHKGRPLEEAALQQLEPLNQVLARDEEFGQIVAREHHHGHQHESAIADRTVSGLAWRAKRRWRSPDSLLLPIARAMADLLCDHDFTDVKACEGPSCTLLFVDRTRGRVRRWCSMAVCGNRAKQAAHRERASRQSRNEDIP
ncbi:MAG TPA: ABATE domain-containing protein [Aliidongia sp.]|nr:ABATE domain-containing protein [Aliidongia sp.]